MQKLTLLPILAFLLFAWSCNSSDKKTKEQLKDEIRKELKAEMEQEKNSPSQSESPANEQNANRKTINAKFEMMVANTAGTYYVFKDENGNKLNLFPTQETRGMDFAKNLQPGDTGHKYYGNQYEISYEKRRVEVKGEYIDRLFILESNPISSTSKTNEQAESIANSIKNIVFTGTEPFWSIRFYDDYAEKNDPSGEKVKFYYLKNGNVGTYKLSEVIELNSSNRLIINITDESQGASGVITITEEDCSDGMSDNIYPFTFSLKWEDGGGWQGCGSDDSSASSGNTKVIKYNIEDIKKGDVNEGLTVTNITYRPQDFFDVWFEGQKQIGGTAVYNDFEESWEINIDEEFLPKATLVVNGKEQKLFRIVVIQNRDAFKKALGSESVTKLEKGEGVKVNFFYENIRIAETYDKGRYSIAFADFARKK